MDTQTTTRKARPYSLTARLHASVTEYDHFDLADHVPASGESYLIYVTRVRPDDLRRGTITRWELSGFPARTNLSHEEKPHGRLGTSGEVERVAAGYVRILRAGPRTVRLVEAGWSLHAYMDELDEIADRLKRGYYTWDTTGSALLPEIRARVARDDIHYPHAPKPASTPGK